MPRDLTDVTDRATSRLSAGQRELIDRWLPGFHVVHDHSWGLVETRVLEVEHGGERFIIKAGGPSDGHIERELRAHREWLAPWTSIGRAPCLVRGDVKAKLLVTHYLPGRLVLDTTAQEAPETYLQTGQLLALLHRQLAVVDDAFEARQNARSLAWLDGPHRIAPGEEAALRAQIASWPCPPATLVPTHGDWQPRNWLVHEDTISVIDFGRADLRPAMADFGRLAVQDFARNPALETAFVEGYGSDPRDPEAWHRTSVREAIGTAAWAHAVGDKGFEAQGHRMIAALLA